MRFSEPNPRKGTETTNKRESLIGFPLCFSEPNPRKGTETRLTLTALTYLFLGVRFSEPNPRKGTETPSGVLGLRIRTGLFFRT